MLPRVARLVTVCDSHYDAMAKRPADGSNRAILSVSSDCRRKLFEAINESPRTPAGTANGDNVADGIAGSAPGHIYSRSGADLINVLGRVARRGAPKVELGPVDLACPISVAQVEIGVDEAPKVRYVDVNDAFLALLGYGKDEVLGAEPGTILRTVDALEPRTASTEKHAVDLMSRQLYRQAIAGNEQQVILTLRCRDGSHKNVLSR